MVVTDAAAEVERLIVRLTGDAVEYTRMLSQAQAQTMQTAGHIEAAARRIESFKASLQGFALATVGALSLLGAKNWLEKAFGEFTTREEEAIKLEAALRANGRVVEDTVMRYQKFASEMQKITVIGDDAVIAMLKTAESFQLTGDAAERAVGDAIALAGATDASAEAAIRITQAMAKGNVEQAMAFSRMIKELRGMKDQQEFQLRYQKLVAGGMETQTRLAETAAGRIKQLTNAYGDLLEDIGETVASGVKPFVESITELVFLLQKLSPESKRMAVIIAAVAVALLSLGPALLVAKLLFAPLGALLGIFITTLGALLSPVGLAVAAIAGLGVAVLHWSGEGGRILGWFGEQWQMLLSHVGPAVQGIKDALAAGDLALAFEIAWLQIQLSFARATEEIRKLWTGLKTMLIVQGAQTASQWSSAWESATTAMAGAFIDLQFRLDRISKETRNTLMSHLRDINEEAQAQIKATEKARTDAAEEAGRQSIQAIEDNIKRLELERAKKLAEAASLKEFEEARKRLEKPFKPILSVISSAALPKLEVKIVPRFDAAEFRSAESDRRIVEFRTRLQAQLTDPTGSATNREKELKVLNKMEGHLAKIEGKPSIDLEPAGLA